MQAAEWRRGRHPRTHSLTHARTHVIRRRRDSHHLEALSGGGGEQVGAETRPCRDDVRGGARWLLMQTDGEQSGRAMCRDGRRRRRCRDGRGCLVIQHRSQRNATRARRADDSGSVAKRGDQCNCCGGCVSPPYPAGRRCCWRQSRTVAIY